MPPKKSRAPASSSQQTPAEPPRQTRAGRKRRNSDASNASDRPSSSHSIASTPAKRRKRAKTAASVEPEAILEEDEEPVFETALANDVADVAEETVRPERRVQFGVRQSLSVRLSEGEKATATHITPHPLKRLSIKRRHPGSPSANGQVLTRKKITTTRHSLPPALSQEAAYVEEENHEFSSLHQVVEARKQLLSTEFIQRHARLRELEAQRQFDTDANGDIEAEILELKQLLHDDAEAAEGMDFDDDMYVLERQQVARYPELPKEPPLPDTVETKLLIGEEHSLSQSQRRSREQVWAAERERLETAVVTLSREANEHKTALQILEIELQSLGIGEGVDSRAILASIRESFVRVRESLEAILPGSLPEDVTSEDVINILVANVKEFADRLKIQDRELHDKSDLIKNLSGQIDSLIDRLAEADFRKDQLEEARDQAQARFETKNLAYYDLETEIQEIQAERDSYQDDLEAKEKEAQSLIEDLAERDSNIDLLTQSIQDYQSEKNRLTELITRMEEEHGTTLAKMNSEREDTVRDLEDRYDQQAQERAAAQKLAEERQAAIDSLELKVKATEKERDDLQQKLDVMATQRDDEAEAREGAEAELQERTLEVEDLSSRVDRLEDELSDLTAQFEELVQLHETERTQRETAENALDAAKEEIEALNQKLRDQGTQANELRQKLFEVQQNHQQKVKELEEIASDRDQQYQDGIQEEVDRREVAELESQERANTIEELRARLEEVELQMSEAIAERDQRIVALEQEAITKDSELKDLRDDLQHTNHRYEALEAESAQTKEELDASVAALQATISVHEATISELQQELLSESALHTSELEERNGTIAELNHDIAILRAQAAELESAKTSLERRVEQEAEQMLQLQADKEDQIEVLKATIEDKQAKIQVVEQKAIETDQRWQDLLNAREEDIRELREEQTSSTETVAVLSNEIQVIKARFAEYIRRSSGRISHLQEDLARAKATADQEGADIIADGEGLLIDLEAMRSVSASVTTRTPHSSQSRKQVGRQTRSSKRVQDSGIGMDEENDDAMIAA